MRFSFSTNAFSSVCIAFIFKLRVGVGISLSLLQEVTTAASLLITVLMRFVASKVDPPPAAPEGAPAAPEGAGGAGAQLPFIFICSCCWNAACWTLLAGGGTGDACRGPVGPRGAAPDIATSEEVDVVVAEEEEAEAAGVVLGRVTSAGAVLPGCLLELLGTAAASEGAEAVSPVLFLPTDLEDSASPEGAPAAFVLSIFFAGFSASSSSSSSSASSSIASRSTGTPFFSRSNTSSPYSFVIAVNCF
mmetsp:Transcript_1123/g.2415  ORF Transcript_1123/g.2415 Transcript_1123/m.2415 type:complete len:247 (-) Transcript_1123:2109-2849(-)